MKIFRDLLLFLIPQERLGMVKTVLLMLLMGFLDAVGGASIMPFIAIVADNSIIFENKTLNYIFTRADMGISSFLIAFGFLVLLVLILTIAVRSYTSFSVIKFAQSCENTIGLRLVRAYLNQPYGWYIQRNSTDLTKTVLSELTQAVHGFLIPLLIILSNIIVILSIVTLLVIVDLSLALIVIAFILFASSLIFFCIKNRLKLAGFERERSNQQRFLVLAEAFGGIKEIKVSKLEDRLVGRFSQASLDYCRSHTTAHAVSHLPRFFLESVTFGSMLLIVLYFINLGENFHEFLPIVTLYAYAGYRLLPSLQQLITNFTTLKFSMPALEQLLNSTESLHNNELNKECSSRRGFNDEVALENVNFQFTSNQKLVLKDININIRSGLRYGFVGRSGSGKTTVTDLLLGLVGPPNQGSILIDGLPCVTPKGQNTFDNVGYVPQQIFLFDDTVASNVAFLGGSDDIDYGAVEFAAKQAHIHDFILTELPLGYENNIGERGSKLSGGQRQRIGIARALYKKPRLLILDEATSALDSITETSVMNSIIDNKNIKTIIVVAHRFKTVQRCDWVYLFDRGEVIASGTFSHLWKTQPLFRELAGD